MKKFAMAGLVLLAATQAQADGFVCQTEDQSLQIKVYNNTQPERGTRNAAVMVLSDPRVQDGRKTIARFTDVNGTLANSGATYEANVDLRFRDSRRKGEYLMGTRLGQLDAIILDVAFSYGSPVRAGDVLHGEIVAIKRSGERLSQWVICNRYLKN